MQSKTNNIQLAVAVKEKTKKNAELLVVRVANGLYSILLYLQHFFYVPLISVNYYYYYVHTTATTVTTTTTTIEIPCLCKKLDNFFFLCFCFP